MGITSSLFLHSIISIVNIDYDYTSKKSITYNTGILQGIISKLYKIQGTSIINAITIGNKTVQQ